MRKFILSGWLISFSAISALGQHTLIYTNPDQLYNQGKELYVERKYAASYRNLEDFLKSVTPIQTGQMQEAEFYMAADAFELKQEDAELMLNNYLQKYPYTPFFDKTNVMLGTLEYEKKNYSGAIGYFSKVNEQHLNRHEQADYLFRKGYAFLETKQFAPALTAFGELKEMKNRYQFSATYYYAYLQYAQGNYQEALPEFLKIETSPGYKKIVPYYVVQIYYAQKQYDQLYQRGEDLLKNNPDNPNNAEIYRIMGEIAYRNKNFAQAITYLKSYEKMFPQVLRNDIYLLGLSYYETDDYPDAVKYLSKATTTQDEMTENAYMHLGNSYVRMNDIANAKLAYEAALRTNFNKSVREEALYNYALTTYQSTSAFGESVKAFEQLLTEFPDTRYRDKAYNYLASVYMTTKNYDAAYESIRKIAQPNARLLETKQYLLYQLGTEAFAQNNFEKAIEYFTLSLQSSSNGKYSAECLYWRSESYYRTGRPDMSMNDLKAFFNDSYSKTSINRVIAMYAMGYAYFSQKNYSTAQNWFLRYVSAEANHSATTYADALNRIGDTYFIIRNFSQATAYYNKAAIQSPATADYAMFQSAYVSGLQKNYREKIDKLNKLIAEYPKSDYADNAMYEIGRSYLMMNNDAQAINTYHRLIATYPNGDQARKAALETGMIYFNDKEYQQAIAAYKNVIANYPGTNEAYTALQSMQAVYVEINDVASYIAYTKSLGNKMVIKSAGTEDSLSYVAAEKQYMDGKYSEAIAGMKNYLSKYCPGSRYCITARYYLADSYYHSNDLENALAAYQDLLQTGNSEFTEEATMRCAGILYDKKDYSAALGYFKQLQQTAQSADNKNVGRLGVLRCSFFLNDNPTTISIAGDILSDPKTSDDIKNEARYNRAKAYLALNQNDLAEPDLKLLAADTRTAFGAESKYLLANLYFSQGKMKEAENEILDFAKKNTPYQFWLARSFVLLADIYIKKGDDFQAKQYLLSLQKNYTVQDDIQSLINERLKAISERENSKVIN